jgi:hypothetical protein
LKSGERLVVDGGLTLRPGMTVATKASGAGQASGAAGK